MALPFIPNLDLAIFVKRLPSQTEVVREFMGNYEKVYFARLSNPAHGRRGGRRNCSIL
jgi:hypothetical protein